MFECHCEAVFAEAISRFTGKPEFLKIASLAEERSLAMTLLGRCLDKKSRRVAGFFR